jgi:hypothetical protein
MLLTFLGPARKALMHAGIHGGAEPSVLLRARRVVLSESLTQPVVGGWLRESGARENDQQ